MALPKKNRLTKKEIEIVFKNGRTVKSSSLFVKIAKNNIGYSRFTFIIPSKKIALAVDRNKAKRLFFEEVRKNSVLLRGGYDIVGVISKKVGRSWLKYLAKELREVLSKI